MQRGVWSQGKSILSVVASAACHGQLYINDMNGTFEIGMSHDGVLSLIT